MGVFEAYQDTSYFLREVVGQLVSRHTIWVASSGFQYGKMERDNSQIHLLYVTFTVQSSDHREEASHASEAESLTLSFGKVQALGVAVR